jgi:hypothetical protein
MTYNSGPNNVLFYFLEERQEAEEYKSERGESAEKQPNSK